MRGPAAVYALIASLFFILLAGPTIAGQYEDGFSAYRDGDFGKAIKLLIPLAEQGDARTYIIIANCYLMGGDPGEAGKWVRKAEEHYRKPAEQGDAKAQFNLGNIYTLGLGVPKDDVQAYMWMSLGESGVTNTKERENYKMILDYTASKMTPEQVAEAKRKALEWKPKKEK